jgi:hypothetical protein
MKPISLKKEINRDSFVIKPLPRKVETPVPVNIGGSGPAATLFSNN